MLKRGQIYTNIFIFILTILVIVLTINFAFNAFNAIKERNVQAQVDTFVVTLEKTMKRQVGKPSGSVTPLTVQLPPQVKAVCFVDDSEQLSKHSSIPLTKEKEIYKDKNLFFFPTSTELSPVKIFYFKLNQSQNPLCINAVNNKLNLKLTSLKSETLIEASNSEDQDQTCIVAPGSEYGDSDKKIDIVFLGYGYKNKSTFSIDVANYANNYFLRTEPYMRNKEKFNLWMIDKMEPDCDVGSYIFCDSLSVNKISSECPNDYVIVLAEKDKVKYTTRSSAVSNMVKVNTRDNKLVFLHEFAHIIANIADEYVDEYYEGWFDAKDYDNCDSENCNSWKDVAGADCIKGCSTNQFYRSVDMSIMRNYDKSNTYGLLNERIIQRSLDNYE